MRELKILLISKHPNIIKAETAFEDDTNKYFLLQLAENGSLSQILKVTSKD
jgi:serine/threonine protein kinase